MMRRAGLVVAALLVAALVLVAVSARAPYEIPARRFVEPTSDFVATVPTREDDARRVVVLIFDGLSPAAVRAAPTPHLDRMAAEGASTLALRPEFPTLSLPNHFVLGTGCRPEHHGIVSNHFDDPERGIYNAKGDADWLVECELIHEVAEAQGVRSAALGTVGNSSTRRGRLATIAEPFREPPPTASEQIDRVLELFETHPELGLITAYVTEPDSTGHAFGPDAPETLAVTAEVDAQIGRVLGAIDAGAFGESVTLIVTTDHGMVDAVNTMLNWHAILREAGVDGQAMGAGVVAHVYLDRPDERPEARAALSNGRFFDVIDPADPPPGVHVGASARSGDLILVAHPGYWGADLAHVPWYLRWLGRFGSETLEVERARGMHGYPVEADAGVNAVFFAWGEAVPAGVELSGMESVDVHPTVAALLGIEPGDPVDGQAHPRLGGGDSGARSGP